MPLLSWIHTKSCNKWEMAESWCSRSGLLGMAPGCHLGCGVSPAVASPSTAFAAMLGVPHRAVGEGWSLWNTWDRHPGKARQAPFLRTGTHQQWGQHGPTCPADPLAPLLTHWLHCWPYPSDPLAPQLTHWLHCWPYTLC